MKLKKVAALCNAVGRYTLWNQVDREGTVEVQWLGDNCSLYPLYGLPYLQEDELYRMFDVPEKKQEKSYLSHEQMPKELCTDDFCAGEIQAESMEITVSLDGTVLMPLRQQDGRILYIQRKYLGPLEDRADTLEYFVRTRRNEGRYVAVKTGMMIAGIILPYDCISERFVEKLDELVRLSRWELGRKQSENVPDPVDDEQENLWEGGNEES